MVPKMMLVVAALAAGFVNDARAEDPPAASSAKAEGPKLDPAIVKAVADAVQDGEVKKLATVKKLRTEARRLRTRNLRKQAAALDASADKMEGEILLSWPKLFAPFEVGQLGHVGEPFEVVSIVDDANVIAMGSFDGRPQTVWIRGVDAKDLATDSAFRLAADGVWHIQGTKEYETALGATNRVLLLVPLDLAPYLVHHQKRLDEKAKGKR